MTRMASSVRERTPRRRIDVVRWLFTVDPFGNLLGLQGVASTPHYSADRACAPATT
ncbi:hypothetical protein [Geodermatophilus chilensis]|uniref:hypothetical protein n=1 Tax=Geodermatophilus chilensis TaxID=2035835 RepID=UPI0038CC1D7E